MAGRRGHVGTGTGAHGTVDVGLDVGLDVDVDVVVVGGGPVGLAAAIGARQRGLSAVIVEPRSGPIDKACGEGLMPGAVAELARLGVHPVGHTIAGIAYNDGRRRAAHVFLHGSGLGVRRTELSALLLGRAEQCGVVVQQGRVRQLAQDARGVTLTLGDGTGIRGRWVLGADGLHSAVRRLAGLDALATRRASGRVQSARRYGLRQHFEVEPWSDLVEVFWHRGFEVYVTPVGERMIGVAALGPRGLDFADVLRSVPPLAALPPARRLAASPLQGGGSLRQRTRGHASGRIMLIGDASGYVDALTGEGMRVGFAQAAAALRSLAPAAAPAHAPVGRRVDAGTGGAPAATARRSLAPVAAGSAAVASAGVDAGVAAAPAGITAPASTTGPAGITGPACTAVPDGTAAPVPAISATEAAGEARRAAERYEREWRAVSGTSNRLTSTLLLAAQSPLRGAIVPLGHRVPALFGAAVEQVAR